jgi:RNA polymerase sigma factor (sigma-70 family)
LRHLELDRPLREQALREIERSLYGKLKAHRLSESFIRRCSEDAVQKGLLEYLRAIAKGVEVGNRDAFIVSAAFCRAIDELRREARHADSGTLEGILESGHEAAPATEELAIEHLAVAELREAIETLPPEERQVLSLHYFEQLSAERSAEIMYCSERTFRRRLAKALRDVSQRLGVAAPEPGSDLAIEIGLIAWASLGGGRALISRSPIEPLIGIAERARDGANWLIDRLRELGPRLTATETSERVSAVASGPAGKFAGGCAGAAIVCVLGGVVGAGSGPAGLFGTQDLHQVKIDAPTARQKGVVPTEPWPVATPPNVPAQSPGALRQSAGSGAEPERTSRRAERRRVEEQTSGIARAGSESSPQPPRSTSSAAPSGTETVTVPSTDSSGESGSASEAAQAKQQFGAFK